MTKSKNITPESAFTSDMADDCCHRALPAVDVATEKIRNRYLRLTRLFLRLLVTEKHKATERQRLPDTNLLRANRRYQYLLFQSGK